MNEYLERGVGVGVELMVKHFLVSTVALLMVQRLSINLSITHSYRNYYYYYYYQLLYSSLERREIDRGRERENKSEWACGWNRNQKPAFPICICREVPNYTILFRLWSVDERFVLTVESNGGKFNLVIIYLHSNAFKYTDFKEGYLIKIIKYYKAFFVITEEIIINRQWIIICRVQFDCKI